MAPEFGYICTMAVKCYTVCSGGWHYVGINVGEKTTFFSYGDDDDDDDFNLFKVQPFG
ncbi:MAG: hypothetical protein GY810_25275 [Aureispira sp.]|nr:hypothetical protein [Aureispira sp.]